MCGIAGIQIKDAFVGKFPVNAFVDALLLGIEHRGRDATGFLSITGKKSLTLDKRPMEASAFILERKPIPDDAKTILLHTRLATQGHQSNFHNNHPVMYDTCFVTHNGVIHNDDTVFEKLSITRRAQVDSEAIPAALTYHGLSEVADIKSSLGELSGSFAIAAVDPIKCPGKLLLAKGSGSPLWILNHKKAVIWASTQKAITDAWGALIGTPPTKKMNPFGLKPDYMGFRDAAYGEMWLVEGDDLLRDTFQTSSYGGTTYRSSGSTCSAGTEDWDDADNYGYAYYGAAYHSNGRKKEWTCNPDSWSCKHPCDAGCSSAYCRCYKGSTNHPKVSAVALERTEDGTWVPVEDEIKYCKISAGIRRLSGSCPGCWMCNAESHVSEFCHIRDGVVEPNDDCSGCWLCPTETEEGASEECWACMDSYPVEQLDMHTFGDKSSALICQDCQLAWQPLTKEGRSALDDYKRALDEEITVVLPDERSQAIHVRACKELSFELDCSVGFIQWLLEDATDDDLGMQDGWLRQLKDLVKNEYQLAKEIAEVIVSGKA